MAIIMTFVWGGAAFLIALAMRRERQRRERGVYDTEESYDAPSPGPVS